MRQFTESRCQSGNRSPSKSMTYSFRIDRNDGENTGFDFTETTDPLDGVFDVLKTLGITKSDLFKGSQLYKDLADFRDLKGRWQSSDSDSNAAAVDIQNKIRTEFGFETKITMLNEEGNKINNECYSGTFLIERTSN